MLLPVLSYFQETTSSGTRDNPPYRGNFTERLCRKKLHLLSQ